MNRNVLITGGAGFIGSNFVKLYTDKYPEHKVINLDLLTYAGNLENLKSINSNHHQLVKGDISNRELVENIFSEHKIDSIFHFAAESHVDNSISGPEVFVKTNVLGTFTLLDVAKSHWLEAPNTLKSQYKNSRFLHVSTDEVYGELEKNGYFTEETPYAPNSPYSATKAGSDLLVRAYNKTYGLNTVTMNCSNNYGPNQHSEKLIPTVIRTCLSEKPIPVYGKGENIRDWLYVTDYCHAIDLAFDKGRSGESYNVGSDNEQTNINLVRKICQILDGIHPRKNGKHEDLIRFVTDRPGHDFRYAIDAKKIKNELGWKAEYSFESSLKQTVQWYVNQSLS